MNHTPSQAEQTLAAIQRLRRCPVCREPECECWQELAAFGELLAAAEEMRDWAMVITLGESPGHPLPKLRAAIKRARSV